MHIAIPFARRAALLAGVLAATAFLPAVAQENPVEKLPADMLYCVSVRDVGELRQRWNDSRFGAAWESTEFAPVRQFALSEWAKFAKDFEEESHVAPDALLEQLDGFAAFFSTYASYRTVGDDQVSEYDLCFVAEVPEEKREAVRGTIDKLLAEVPSTATKAQDEFGGTTINVIRYTEETPVQSFSADPSAPTLNDEVTTTIQYAFVGDMLVFAEGPNEPAKKIISSLTTDSLPRVGTDANFRTLAERTKGLGSITAWANVPLLLDVARKGPDGEQASMAFTQLGIAEMGPALATFDLDSEGLLGRSAAIMPRDRTGIVAMLYSGEPNGVEAAARVPADSNEFYSWTLDLESFWGHLATTIQAMNPQAQGMIAMGMMTMQANYGVNLQTDVIAKISGEHAIYTRRDPSTAATAEDGSPQLPQKIGSLLLGLRGGADTAASLNAIMQKLGTPPADGSMATGISFESANVEGTTVWSMPADMMPPDSPSPAWAFTPAFAVVANEQSEALQILRQASGADATSLALQPDFRAAVDAAPKANLRLFAYSSPDNYGNMVDGLRFMFANFGMMDDEFTLKPEDVPPLEWWKRYLGPTSAWVSLEPGMLTSDYRLKTVGGK